MRQLNQLNVQVGASLKINSAQKKNIQKQIKMLQSGLGDLQLEIGIKNSGSNTKRTSALKEIHSQTQSIKSELNAVDEMKATLGSTLKSGLSKVLGTFGKFNVISQLNQQLRKAWKEAMQLDSSITSLSKVCDELADRSSFPAYIDKSISKAKELCTDVNDLLYATTEFKKLGNTLKNSEILAEYAIRLQNVGDTDIDTAISSIKTAMASFDEIGGYTDNEYENKVEAYIDLINNLSNKFSVDAEDLANSIRISAGTLTEANVSIEEAASVISAANKYYDDPTYLANTLKIGALRLRASKTSDEAKKLAELGENIDDLAESTSKLRDEMMSLTGVDIMVDDKNFKSYYQQLLDISKIYQTLDETTQANVLEKMFGKNRSAAGASILRAMSDTVEVYNEALQSAGSSEEEFSRWSESAEAATKRFGTAMTETYNNIINGETVKGLTNAATAVLDFANKWGIVEASFKGFLTLGILKGITKITVAFKNSAVQLSNYASALDAVKKVSAYAQDTREYAKAMDTLKNSCTNLTDAQLKQVLANRNLSNSQLNEILQLDLLEEEKREARLSQLGLTQATNANTGANTANAASVTTLKGAFKGLAASVKTTWAAIGSVGWIIAASAASVGLAYAIQSNIKTLKEWKNELENAKNSISEYESEITELESEINNVNDKINEIGENPVNVVDQKTLETLKATRGELEQQLQIVQSLNETAKDIAENATMKILENSTKIVGAVKTIESLKNFDIWGALTSTDAGFGGILKTIEEVKEKNYKEAIKHVSIGFLTNTGNPIASLYNWLYPKKENEKSILEETTEQINKLAEARNKLNSLKEERVNGTISEEKYQKDLQKINDVIQEQSTELSSNIKLLQEYKSQLDDTDPVQLEWINKIKEVEDAYTASLVNKDGYRTFDDIINSNIYGSSRDELIKLAKQGELTADILDKEYHNLSVLFNALELDVDDVIEKLKEMGEEVESTDKNISNPTFSFTEDQSKAIDEFQSKVKTLKSALSSLQSGEMDSSALLDLRQEFPELQNNTSNLEQAIKDLINNALKELYNVLGENLPEHLKNELQNIADTASNAVPSLEEAFSSIKQSHQVLEEFKGAMSKGTLTDSVLSSVSSLSAHLKEMVANYYAGIVTSKQLYEALVAYYQKDLKNYAKYLTEENELNEDFYKSVILSNQDLVKELAEIYNVDLNNFKNIQQMKAGFASEMARSLDGIWNSYSSMTEFEQISVLYTNAKNRLTNMSADDSEYEQAEKEYERIEKQYLKALDAKNALEEGITDSIGDSFEANFDLSFDTGSSSEPSYTVFDWIETRIERTEEAIDRLNGKLDSVSDYTSQNNYIDEMLSSYKNELPVLDEAKEKYLELAEAVGLSAAYISKIKDGTLDVEKISDETIKRKIEEYQKWYEKAQETESSISDIIKKTKELNRQKLDNIINDYDRVTSLVNKYSDYLQKLVDVKEAKNNTVAESDYIGLMQQELNLQATLQEQYNKVKQEIANLGLTPSDDEYYERQEQLIDLQLQIEDCTTSVEEFKDAIADIRWNNFEIGTSMLDNYADEISDVITLLGDGTMFKDGEITDIGITKIGLYAQQYVNAKQQIAEYQNAMKQLETMYKHGMYSQEEYTQKMIEFQQATRDAALSVKSAKEEIISFHKEAIEEEIDSMRELVNEKKKALDAERDYYNYRQSISKQQKNIVALERRIAVLSLSDSRADRALRLKLEEELAKEKAELRNEEYSHSIDNQRESLDQTLEIFEKEKNEEIEELENNLDKQEDLIEKYLDKVVDNYDIVYDNIQNISDKFGIEFTDSLTSPWESASNAAELYAQAVGDVLAQLQIDSSKIQDLTGTSMGTEITGNKGQSGEWIKQDEKWWYKHTDGSYTQNGWEQIDGKWYHFDPEGWMDENKWIDDTMKDGNWYYVGSDGAMLTNTTTPDGYQVDSHGAWIKDNASDGNTGTGSANKVESSVKVSSISPNIEFGDRGSNVETLQTALEALGYSVGSHGIDGKFGSDTLGAVKEFQSDSGISVDGIVGSDTKYQFKLRGYRNGTKSNPRGQLAVVDENGEELVLHAGSNGRVEYLTKGSSVIPSDLTERLMNMAKKYDWSQCISTPNLNLSNHIPEIASRNSNTQHVSVNINSPLMEVHGGLDSSIMAEVDKKIGEMPERISKDIKSELKRMVSYR